MLLLVYTFSLRILNLWGRWVFPGKSSSKVMMLGEFLGGDFLLFDLRFTHQSMCKGKHPEVLIASFRWVRAPALVTLHSSVSHVWPLHTSYVLCVCVHMCVWEYVEARGQHRHCFSLIFETVSLAAPGTHRLARLSSQQAPGMFLSLPGQYWDPSCMLQCLAFYAGSGLYFG